MARTLDNALDRLRRLSEENASLRRGRDQLAGERAALMTRNEQARTRVEAMIERLKSLEGAG
ncbi:MAG: TIGR02449 family protein [Rhodanobacteraceae bacterium]